jgi:hypothetical protein
MVPVEPTLFAIAPNALAALDAQVHPASVIWMPPRAPSAIPRPQSTARPAAPPTATPQARFETPIMIVCTILATVWGLINLAATIGLLTDPKNLSDWATWFVLGCVWLIQGLLAWPIIKIARRRRARRS